MTEQNVVPIDILLVDDSPSDVLIAKEALALSKLLNRIHVVGDGEEALDFLYKRGVHSDAPRPGLILLDLNLPKRNGREVLEVIKRDDALRSIPVVVLTTSNAQTDVAKSYELHANSYIVKPVDFDQFSQLVQALQNYWFCLVTLPPENGPADSRKGT